MLLYFLEADVNKLSLVIDSVLAKHYISLRALSWNGLHHLADQMYDADFITADIQKTPTFDNIMAQLTVELNLMSSISQIQQYCTKFLSMLSDMGGPYVGVSQALQQDWIKESRAKCGVKLQLGM